jgi:hypothetical protein
MRKAEMMMNRRGFLWLAGGTFTRARGGGQRQIVLGPQLAITMDDPKTDISASLSAAEINRRILNSLSQAKLRAALFVTGMRIDNPAGPSLIAEWAALGL